MVAAKLETSIEQELVERLTKGTYGDIYNFPETPYQKVMQQLEDEQEEIEVESEDEEGMMKYVEDLNDDEEDEEEDIEDMGFTKTWDSSEDESTAEMDSDEDDDDEEDEDEDDEHSPTKQKKERKNSKTMRKKKLGPRVEIEYEEENDGERATERQEMTTAWWGGAPLRLDLMLVILKRESGRRLRQFGLRGLVLKQLLKSSSIFGSRSWLETGNLCLLAIHWIITTQMLIRTALDERNFPII